MHLAAVRRAVFAGRRLRLRYAARDEPARWRTVDPVGLVEARGRWYLLATRDGVERTYRISRVEAVEELDEPVRRGPEVDLEQAWQRRRAAFAADAATLVGDRPGAGARAAPSWLAAALGRRRGAAPPGPATCGRGVVRRPAPRRAGAVDAAATTVEVLAPASLRDAIAGRAAAVAALYT